jgi:8-oxo-dGTP diphosphatase
MSNFSAGVRVRVTGSREYPERPMVGVGGVVISGGRALLVRRGRAPLEGQWSIPGGMLEVGETLLEGVRRELLEETGIEVRVGELIEVFERIMPDGGGKTHYHFVVLDYLCEAVSGEARPGSDVVDVAWAAPSELATYSISETATRVILKAFEMASRTPKASA